MKSEIDDCYEKSFEVLKKISTKYGMYASEGYKGVWARDSMISLIGASSGDKNKRFKKVFFKSLKTLADAQSKNGQIPNAVFINKKVDYKSIDSSLWFILGSCYFNKKYSHFLFRKFKKNINDSFKWLRYQDIGENGMLAQLPTTDWQDAFPHKYGYTINTNALYYKVLITLNKKNEAEKLRNLINNSREDGLWNKNYYYSYRWKNHGKYKEKGRWFDSLGNLLAIIFDVADKKKSEKIISYIKREKIDSPYPLRAIYPPIGQRSVYWQDYYLDSDAGKENCYLNSGVWTFIGGFYVLALMKLKKYKDAEIALEKIAEANLKGNFPEWIHPITKKSYGKLQAWNAGMYIVAYESVKNFDLKFL